jgi:general secretion pathway protein D
MSIPFSNWHKHLGVLAALSLCAAIQAHAQGRGGGFGGGGGGFGGGGRGASTTSSPYPSATTIGDAYFSVDPESRRVAVIADEDTLRAISLVISNLDRPKPQVLISVVFLEVTYNTASDIGIEGGFNKALNTSGNQSTMLNGANGLLGPGGVGGVTPTNFNAIGQPSSLFQQAAPMSSPGAGLWQIVGQNYQATLRLIAQAGSTKVLSRPTILARNNQPATIVVGQEVPLITGVRYDNYGNVINTITYQEVGVILTVTPFITPQGMVEMIISPQISGIDPTLAIPISATATAPVIDIRQASTVAVTGSGKTIVIGGLIQDDKTLTVLKTPILGDIPLLGNLFKRTQKSNAKTELIIFMTPYVGLAPEQFASITESEKERSDGPKAFTEKELNRFLDTLPDNDKPKASHKDSRKSAPKEAVKDAPTVEVKVAPKVEVKETPKEEGPKAAPKEPAKDTPKVVAKEAPKEAPKADANSAFKEAVPPPSPAIDSQTKPLTAPKDSP